jgi:DNA-nicking Smr family endonuclease
MTNGFRRPPRRLTPGEIELWSVVTADVRPMRLRPPTPSASPPEKNSSPSPGEIVGSRREPEPPRPSSPPPAPPPRIGDLDHRTRVKIKRGRLDVDAKLDLHGMRQDEAQRALSAFLRRSQAAGAKVAIVVTGKGLSREDGGVLRRMVPMWLQAPALRDVVVSFGEAARRHGGEGALYVRIRRADRARG